MPGGNLHKARGQLRVVLPGRHDPERTQGIVGRIRIRRLRRRIWLERTGLIQLEN